MTMASSSSLGLRIGISPEIAEKMREAQQSFGRTDSGTIHEEEESLNVISTKKSVEVKSSSLLPSISIHVEKLVGYQTNDAEELSSIRTQLIEAMWNRYQQTTSDGILDTKNHQVMQPPPDFDLQVMEFLESGVARYCGEDTEASSSQSLSSHDEKDGRLLIRYPEYLQSPVTGERITTHTLVEELRKEPHLDFLKKIWKYLRECSRTLFWKRDMAIELAHLVREEQARLEYQEWDESKRQKKLDNLYSVRETLVHQVEIAKSKVDLLEEDRETQVKKAMEPLQRKILSKQQDSISAFGTSELSFPDEFQWLGLRDEPLDEEDDWGTECDDPYEEDNVGRNESDDGSQNDNLEDNFSENESGYEIEDDIEALDDVTLAESEVRGEVNSSADIGIEPAVGGMGTVHEESNTPSDRAEKTNMDEEPVLLLPFQRRKKRREKSKRRRREENKEAERKVAEEQIRELENGLRNKLTSKELILAQTMYNALSEKMTKIEELLDSLQDEVWQAQEEAEAASNNELSHAGAESKPSFSLLDQVLAMILGATPNVDDKKPEEHYLIMQLEHRRIVKAWENHFGRLPPPAGGLTFAASPVSGNDQISSKDKRTELGITENENEDWEALDSLLDVGSNHDSIATPAAAAEHHEAPKNATKKQETAPTAQLVGLRPGGKVIRP